MFGLGIAHNSAQVLLLALRTGITPAWCIRDHLGCGGSNPLGRSAKQMAFPMYNCSGPMFGVLCALCFLLFSFGFKASPDGNQGLFLLSAWGEGV